MPTRIARHQVSCVLSPRGDGEGKPNGPPVADGPAASPAADSLRSCFRGLGQGIGHGSAFQISAAYSAIVRSLENLPEAATLTIALRAQASGVRYSSLTRCWAWAYDVRSARCMK